MAAAARVGCVMAAKRVTERVKLDGIVDVQPRMITSVESDMELGFDKSRL